MVFLFPSGRFFSRLNRLGVLWMRFTAVGTASYDGFSCQLLFHRKEEFAGNALQAGGSSATADLCI
ncbi:hypothetical protein GAC87_17295 [Bacteroides thetaiotaomicron]|uniref:Uncharacterized protein n=9 Tax=Bacteroidales TaxID=171549 RepID=A0A413UYY2_BACSE|nr:hypothetical protein F2A21_11705 [Akkermansia sp. BIOML-A54]KAA5285815.1 hypothetical protein F2Z06_21800 [Phocaeicola dorei]KAB4486386.1 hypothetical protein GAN71_19350 [Bacteroides thetaiotaomicron]MBT9933395.1 hypothetical protein [Bacteroides ovatus]OUO52547.1 hypothetical protein B5F77_07970 [Parabacteroides sp. An277]QCQ43314.1 hypothetical protein HR50_015860 [Bacteroides fragilis]RGD04286.1 hypothetical protein DW215_15140 [Parabacteroides sp. AM18-12LB]RGJ91257.1 hypothetical pr